LIRYIGILEKEPSSLWGIWFPDLPGCVTAAESEEATLDQAAEALQLWIDDALMSGEELPKARSLVELRQDDDVAEALAQGYLAVMVSAPPLDLGLEPPALVALDAAAEKRGLTRLGFVREAVLEKIAG
jgi:predicted RNase H-like HicB family nuclease